MSVLITGGAGFIGGAIGRKFIERGEKVFVLDNLSTGKSKPFQRVLSL